MTANLDQKVRITFPLIAAKRAGGYMNAAQWRFEITADGRSLGRQNQWFEVRAGTTVSLPAAAWSREVDVRSQSRFDVVLRVWRKRFGRSDENLGSFTWSLAFPYSLAQRLHTSGNRNLVVMMQMEQRVRGSYGAHGPLESFVSRDSPSGPVMTTVSGTRVAWRIEACEVKPTPASTARWPKRPALPAGAQSFGQNQWAEVVEPGDPLNILTNPPLIPILNANTRNLSDRAATFVLTYWQPENFPVDELVWSVTSLRGRANAAFVGSNRGASVMLRGTRAGEVQLEIKWRNSRVAVYRALVGSVKTIRYRAQLLRGGGRSRARSTPNQVRRQMDIANRFLYQAGILLRPDDDESTTHGAVKTGRNGVFQIDVARGHTRGVVQPNHELVTGYNYRAGVMNFVYIHSDAGGFLGMSVNRPANGIATSVRDSGTPSTSWKAPTGIPPDRAARSVSMKIFGATLRSGHPQQFGMYLTNGNGNPRQSGAERTYANTIAHELGHTLNLRHRNTDVMRGGVERSGHDGLSWPVGQNLMHHSNPASIAQDIDIIQAKAMRRSPLLS